MMSYADRPAAGPPPHLYRQSSLYGMPVSHGSRVVRVTTVAPKSPGLAIILSVILPGLGHLYVGNTAGAVLWYVAVIAAWLSMLILIGFLLVPFVMFGAATHAYLSAALFNERHHLVA